MVAIVPLQAFADSSHGGIVETCANRAEPHASC